jgi:hypothetical protein
MRLTQGTGDLDDIDLQLMEYSDDDDQIYFTHQELIEHLFKLEDDNLFNVNLLKNDEEQLEHEIKKSSKVLKQYQMKIEEQDKSLQDLEQTLKLQQDKFIMLGGTGQKDQVQETKQTALNKYLYSINAKKSEVDRIN